MNINATQIKANPTNGLIGFSSGDPSATSIDSAFSRIGSGALALGTGAHASATGTLALGAITVGASGTAISQIRVYSQSLDVASVAANTSAEQTFTVTGLAISDKCFVNKPSMSAGLIIGNCRVSAANTLALTFGNLAASAVDPAGETYAIVAIRN